MYSDFLIFIIQAFKTTLENKRENGNFHVKGSLPVLENPTPGTEAHGAMRAGSGPRRLPALQVPCAPAWGLGAFPSRTGHPVSTHLHRPFFPPDSRPPHFLSPVYLLPGLSPPPQCSVPRAEGCGEGQGPQSVGLHPASPSVCPCPLL